MWGALLNFYLPITYSSQILTHHFIVTEKPADAECLPLPSIQWSQLWPVMSSIFFFSLSFGIDCITHQGYSCPAVFTTELVLDVELVSSC